MPKISEAFPSKYLKADDDVPDLHDGGLAATIKDAKFETLGQGQQAEDKIILYFKELEKGLVLNKTNATTITKLVGSDDTDDWIGRPIRLFSTDVEFKGDMMRGIRVSTKGPRPAAWPGAHRRDFDETEAETVGASAVNPGAPPNPAEIARAEGDSGTPF